RRLPGFPVALRRAARRLQLRGQPRHCALQPQRAPYSLFTPCGGPSPGRVWRRARRVNPPRAAFLRHGTLTAGEEEIPRPPSQRILESPTTHPLLDDLLALWIVEHRRCDAIAQIAISLELCLVEELVGGGLVREVRIRRLVSHRLDAELAGQGRRDVDQITGRIAAVFVLTAVGVSDLRQGI